MEDLKPEIVSLKSVRVIRTAVAGLLVLAALLYAYSKRHAIFAKVTWFAIKDIHVESEWPLSPDVVRAALPALQGKSLLAIDGDALMNEVRSLPWVSWVTLKKEFPERLSIEVGTKRAQAMEVVGGETYFIDDIGERIEKATPAMIRALDVPAITYDDFSSIKSWKSREVVRAIETFRRGLDVKIVFSQLALGTYPYFRVFLSHPKVEVSFNFENWESQLPILALLLHSPPAQIGQPQRINLVFPKKAVVSQPALN